MLSRLSEARRPAAVRISGRKKERPERLSRNDSADDVRFVVLRDDHRNPGGHAYSRGLKFGVHSAARVAASASVRMLEHCVRDLADLGDDARVRVRPRVVVVQSVDIREDQRHIRIDERCDHRGERIVVAEFEFFDGDRVVFVDDGNHAPLQERE
ncbi:hypothetical protein SDC9_182961 [bioreactor metagenome]|uniref:Uncharacterized protein n=1 Tax=bioreactor metagenome TaxID=1076179 RepID=A0A645HIG4_9ZZZZ